MILAVPKSVLCLKIGTTVAAIENAGKRIVMMAVAIITIIPSKDYMRYWAFQISFVPENSYNRHCHQERDEENSHHARSPQEGLIRRESKTMKVGLLGTKA